ncbi:MAG: phosphotransferase [Ignavibacteriota bacterium]|jgi:fructosamine-3-kinase|nr:fructosamine kinase [Ignavibacteriota bacterium]MCC7092705.1 fructosamine kinase family protein [Ignavibacteriaceae bacterium]MEB2295847.1 fructosamine kinase family protein [Ignavibacteria bacterium]NUM62550.1 fructosamine kinase family protein [Ignavibacteriaceae bacterium]QKJ97782.1 MAG: phosphotransferase [Ignavibacteriota bacterium]
MISEEKIKKRIEEKLGSKIKSFSSLSGGCISDAFKISTENGTSFFLKYNPSASNDMFFKEANGLRELDKSNAIKIPEVLSVDEDYILLEFIASGNRKKKFFEDFGKSFAEMHKFKSDSFGFYENNYIGSNPQINIPDEKEKSDWTAFYLNKRILFQLQLAEKLGNSTDELRKGISKLENKIEDIIGHNSEKPSLLHGDLWAGNYMIDQNGNAVLIDPAAYYGHREADLGMTKLFGGFNSEFYKAYNESFPLEDGFDYRENIYKLYHVLNHLNLFGGGYYSQAISLIKFYV